MWGGNDACRNRTLQKSLNLQFSRRLVCVILVSHLQVLLDFSEGVEGVSLRAGPGEQGMSAVVVYASHHAASMAKKVLIEGRPGFSWRFSVLISAHKAFC